MKENLGLIHIYDGDGKGKTTCSVGLAIRMVGNGGKVAFLQFMKGCPTGETDVLKKLGVDVRRTKDVLKFYPFMSDEEKKECDDENNELFQYCVKISKEDYDLIILDEIMSAINVSSIKLDKVIDMLKNKNKNTEIVMTGRDPKDELIKIADYVSFVRMDKHPYNEGVIARKGIEF